ncbi:MAG: hypothetical protein ABSG68_26840 [Thermoguttaceae bacterium]|jgi:hypothetical protein
MAARAGILDVDRWLETIAPERLDEWEIFQRIEPDPLDRLREVLKMGFALLAAGLGISKVTPEFFDPVKPEEAAPVGAREAAGMLRRSAGREP